jgi:ATP-dependent DNA helicase RecQ
MAETAGAARVAKAKALLKSVYNHDSFRAGQEAIVKLLLDPPPGQPARAVAIFPTGAGKSLTYQLPALVFERGLTLVVSPLLALMRDQTMSLVSKGVAAASLDSTLDAQETRELYDRIKEGEIKLLFVAPERFKNERFVRLIKRVSVALFVVDEAHCVSEWGHSFRPDYLRLARFADEIGFERRLCLTATATPVVSADIARAMSIPYPAGLVQTPSARHNLNTRVTLIPSSFTGKRKSLEETMGRRIEVLVGRIKSRPVGPTVVYVTLQQHAVTVAESLRNRGLLHCQAYHAGIAQDKRKDIQDWFMASKSGDQVCIFQTFSAMLLFYN